ncbi:MAG: hypothetical protein EA400_10210 [Chromatiaceae bacterium]|nr:MAG: hypothetical protein EA400_10210 [Chromatiaceae bacterium]
MPTLMIKSNALAATGDHSALLAAASARLAELLGKPERYVMVLLEPIAAMSFGGSAAPAAYLELKSLGLPEERTPVLSAALCGLIENHLGVPSRRIYIEFQSPPRHLFGHDGGTF